MSENLKRHRPDIKVLGKGKAIAFMPEDPMGVWCHIQEVRDLLDVKDNEIADLKEKNERLSDDCLIKASNTFREIEKEIHHHEYKRCLAMAKLAVKDDCLPWNMKWHKRWLKLAEKFKPNKEAK